MTEESKFESVTNEIRKETEEFNEVSDLNEVLMETPIDIRSEIKNYGDTFEEVEEYSLPRSFASMTFAQIVPEVNAMVVENDNKLYIVDTFHEGALYEVKSEEGIITAIYCNEHIYLVFAHSVIEISCETNVDQSMNLSLEENTIKFSVESEQKQMKFEELNEIQSKYELTAGCSVRSRIFLGDTKGCVIELVDDKLINVTSFIPIVNDFLSKKTKIIEMVEDESRNVIYALTEAKKILVFEVCSNEIKQVKSNLIDPEIHQIQAIMRNQSSGINLCSTTREGYVSYYTLNEDHQANTVNFTEMDENDFNELKKQSSEGKIEPPNQMMVRKFKEMNGFHLFGDEDELEYVHLDQSIKKEVKKIVRDSGTIKLGLENEKILDFDFISKQIMMDRPEMNYTMQDNHFCNQFYSDEQFLLVVTTKRTIILAVKKPYQNLADAIKIDDEVYNEMKNLYDEVDAVMVMLYIKSVYDAEFDIKKECDLLNSCLVQFDMEIGDFKVIDDNLLKILDKIGRDNYIVFNQAVFKLIAKLLAPLYNYEFFYAPSEQVLQKIDVSNGEICIAELFNKRETEAKPYITFSYIELFNLGVALHKLANLLHLKFNHFTNPNLKIAGVKEEVATETIDDIIESIKYIKDLVFFLSLCFTPQNAQRVIPELITITSGKEAIVTEEILPIFSFNTKVSNNMYKKCDTMKFDHYLNEENKELLEKLVRKLNILLSKPHEFKLNELEYEQDFSEQFKKLCPIMSKIYQNRLQALEELEEAGEEVVSSEEREIRVNTAIEKLKSNPRSLFPLEPLIDEFSKCEALNELVEIILQSNNKTLNHLDEIVDSEVIEEYLFHSKNQANNVYLNETSIPNIKDLKLSNCSEEAVDKAKASYFGEEVQRRFHTTEIKLEERDFDELHTSLDNIFKLVEKEYLLINLGELNSVSDLIMKQNEEKGLMIVEAAVEGSTSKLWHFMFYSYLYIYYYEASAVLDSINRIPTKALAIRSDDKMIFELLEKRSQDALLAIMSPHIKEYLELTDYELYIKYLEKQRNETQILVVINDIVNRSTATSILPNVMENGEMEVGPLNFHEVYELVEMGCSILKLENVKENSLFVTNAASQAFVENDEQSTEIFERLLQLSKIQQELIERYPGEEQYKNQLYQTAILDEKLREQRQFDLSLILQYNVISKSEFNQHIEIDEIWLEMIDGQNLKEDIEKVFNVLSKTKLDSVQLKSVFKVLIKQYQQIVNAQELAMKICERLFENGKPFAYIGRSIRAISLLLNDFKNNEQICEHFSFLLIKMCDLSKNLPVVAEDDDPVELVAVYQKIKSICQSPAILDALKRWVK